MVSPYLNLPLLDAIDRDFGTGWRVFDIPLAPARQPPQLIFPLNSPEYLASMGLSRRMALAAPPDPARALNELFLVSRLLAVLQSGMMVVEARRRDDRGNWSAPETLPSEFWRLEIIRITRSPPWVTQRISGRTAQHPAVWAIFADATIREPSSIGAPAAAINPPSNGQSKTEAARELITKNPERLRGMRFAKDREEFVADNAGCGITVARTALKHWWPPKT